jgi:hypothetical protein
MTQTLVTLLSVFAVALLSALTYATTVGGKALADWLKARAQGSIVARELLVVEDLVMGVVQDIEANEKQALVGRLPGAPLTVDEAKQLKAIAIARAKAIVLARGPATLQAMLGALNSSPDKLDQVLSGKVEQAVAKVSAGISSPR